MTTTTMYNEDFRIQAGSKVTDHRTGEDGTVLERVDRYTVLVNWDDGEEEMRVSKWFTDGDELYRVGDYVKSAEGIEGIVEYRVEWNTYWVRWADDEPRCKNCNHSDAKRTYWGYLCENCLQDFRERAREAREEAKREEARKLEEAQRKEYTPSQQWLSEQCETLSRTELFRLYDHVLHTLDVIAARASKTDALCRTANIQRNRDEYMARYFAWKVAWAERKVVWEQRVVIEHVLYRTGFMWDYVRNDKRHA